MTERLRFPYRAGILFLALTLFVCLAPAAPSGEKSGKITEGQRVFSCGHSFHVFVPGILADIAKTAGIKDHQQLGLSSIGGSRVIQHGTSRKRRTRPRKLFAPARWTC